MSIKTGMIVNGVVTGIQPYGAFVSLEHHVTGLIHISEISDDFVKDIGHYVHVGDTVKVKVIEYDNRSQQAKLSLKALHKTHSRNRKRQTVHAKATLPSMKIGFQSIASHMDQWIKDAEIDILKQTK